MTDTENGDERATTTRRAALRALGVVGVGAGVGPSVAAADAAGDGSAVGGVQATNVSLTTRVVAGDGDSDDGFGYDVAVSESGDTAAFGAVGDDQPNGQDGGAVYVFRRPDAIALDGADDLTGDVTLDGSVDPRETDLVYRGQLLVVDGLTDGETVTVRDADSGLALTERTVSGTAVEIDTGAAGFEQFVGRSFELESQTLDSVPFTFVEQGYELDTDRVTLDNGGDGATVELTVESVNRREYTHVVSSPDLTGAEVAAVVPTDEFVDTDLRDADGDGDDELLIADGSFTDTFQVDATGLAPGEYTLEFGVFDAVATEAVTVEVVGQGPYVQEAKVAPRDGAAGDFFGENVALSGDGSTLVVGTRAHSAEGMGAGAAWVFDREGREWRLTDKLTADDAAAGDSLGNDVAVADGGSVALVGAPGATDDGGTGTGAVYAFERRGALWTQTATIVPDGADEGDGVGSAVALSADGSTALVGASSDDDAGAEDGGAAYVLTRTEDGWKRAARLTPVGGDARDVFGEAVALAADGSTALVGAPDFEGSGTAYVYGRDGGEWSYVATLLGTSEGGGDTDSRFGRSVALSADGTGALVGAPEDGTTGAAYLFGRADTGWQQVAAISPDDTGGVAFGRGAALDGAGSVAVLADHSADNENGTGAGTGFVYGAGDSLSDRFDDGDGEIGAREVLQVIAAYNGDDDDIAVQDVLGVIEAYNGSGEWSDVSG